MTEIATPEIVPADARLRTLVLLASLAILAGGAVAYRLLDRRLGGIDRLAEEDLPAAAEEALSLVVKAAVVMGTSLVGAGLWLFRLGVQINRAGRFPPPGMRVIRDTVVQTGVRARLLANLALISSMLAVLAGTVGMWYLLRVARALLQVP